MMLLFLQESPDAADDPVESLESARAVPAQSQSFAANIVVTLQNPALWLLAVALFFLNACRYGYLDWGVKHLEDVLGKSVDKAAFDIAAIPLGGILGALFSGWATDRFFGGRRAPVICALLVALALLTVFYDPLVRTSGIAGTAVLMVAIGFAIFGAQVLLVGTAPADLARAGTSAAAAGFVNFMGYMGAFGGDFITGWVVDKYDWTAAVMMRAAWAIGAAVAVAFLWNARGHSAK
jgi:sugar phosphate permease